MSGPPTGAVTFLFTDIEGSTRLVKEFRDRYPGVLADHQRLLRGAFKAHGGYEVDTQGDAFFVAFSNARDALLAAVDGQRALLAHDWPEEAQVKVRMGVHTGQAVASDGRYTGLAVHRAARIGSAAHGGQILASQSTQTLVEDEEEDLQLGLRDLGEQRLKDLDRPVRLYQVTAAGLAATFPPLGRDTPRRSRLVLAAVALVVAVGAAFAALELSTGGNAGVTVRPNSVGVIDTKRNVVIDQIPVGSRPGTAVAGGDSLWVANVDDRTIARIDPGTGTVKRYIPLQATPTGLAFAAPYLWIAYGLLGSVGRVNASFNEAEDPVDAGVGPARTAAIAVGFDSVWFVSGNAKIARLDPDSMRATAPLLIAGTSPSGIAVDSTAVWVSNQGDNSVYEISPVTNESIWAPSVSSGPTAVASGDGAVWVSNGSSDSVTRIDPVGRSTVTIPVGVQPTAIAYGAGSVWVANGNDGTVWRIDPTSNEAIAKIHVGNRPSGLAVGDGRVYVTVQAP